MAHDLAIAIGTTQGTIHTTVCMLRQALERHDITSAMYTTSVGKEARYSLAPHARAELDRLLTNAATELLAALKPNLAAA